MLVCSFLLAANKVERLCNYSASTIGKGKNIDKLTLKIHVFKQV